MCSLDKLIKDALACESRARLNKKTAIEKMEQASQKILEGETTGDVIKDYLVVRFGSLAGYEPLKELAEEIERSPGEYCFLHIRPVQSVHHVYGQIDNSPKVEYVRGEGLKLPFSKYVKGFKFYWDRFEGPFIVSEEILKFSVGKDAEASVNQTALKKIGSI